MVSSILIAALRFMGGRFIMFPFTHACWSQRSLPLAAADLTVGPTDCLICLDRMRDGRKLALLIGLWGAPATYSGAGERVEEQQRTLLAELDHRVKNALGRCSEKVG
jgi:two-component sensor histidine kinase